MDWGQLASDASAWGAMAKAKISEVTDKAKEEVEKATEKAKDLVEEAKYRTQPPIVVGPHRVTKVRKLADGGFSEVFLARSADTDETFALKRMVCQTAQAKADAKAELKILKAFGRHPNIISVLGGSAKGLTVPGQRREAMEVHLLFPFYESGTLFDAMWRALEGEARNRNATPGAPGAQAGFHSHDGRGHGSGHGHGGSFAPSSSAHKVVRWPFPERRLLEVVVGVCAGLGAMHARGFAHRDVKPHNVLLGPGGAPVLTDLGSAAPAARDVASRQEAAKVEDDAASKCSAPYRAPELTSVAYPCSLGDAVDVWSLGCTCFALAFDGYSPFESETEGLKRLAILNGRFTYPHERRNRLGARYSPGFASLVDAMLSVDPKGRPSVTAVGHAAHHLLTPEGQREARDAPLAAHWLRAPSSSSSAAAAAPSSARRSSAAAAAMTVTATPPPPPTPPPPSWKPPQQETGGGGGGGGAAPMAILQPPPTQPGHGGDGKHGRVLPPLPPSASLPPAASVASAGGSDLLDFGGFGAALPPAAAVPPPVAAITDGDGSDAFAADFGDFVSAGGGDGGDGGDDDFGDFASAGGGFGGFQGVNAAAVAVGGGAGPLVCGGALATETGVAQQPPQPYPGEGPPNPYHHYGQAAPSFTAAPSQPQQQPQQQPLPVMPGGGDGIPIGNMSGGGVYVDPFAQVDATSPAGGSAGSGAGQKAMGLDNLNPFAGL